MNQAEKALLFQFLKRQFPKLGGITVNQMHKFQISELISELEDSEIDEIIPPTQYVEPPKINVSLKGSTPGMIERVQRIQPEFSLYIARFLAFMNMDQLNDNAGYLKIIRIAYQIPRKAIEQVLEYQLYDKPILKFKEIGKHLCLFVQQAILVGFYMLLEETCDDDAYKLLEILIGDNEGEVFLAQEKLVLGLREINVNIGVEETELIEILYCKYIISQLVNEAELEDYISRQQMNHLESSTAISTACILKIEDPLTEEDLAKYVNVLRQECNVREDCVDYIRNILKPIISNYIEYFAEIQDNFEAFLLLFEFLHCNINKKANFNYQIEKLIVQSFIEQFERMFCKENFNQPKKASIQNFIDFVSLYEQEIECQLEIFLPVLNQFYCVDCFIDLNRKILEDGKYIVNEMLFPGTSNNQFTSLDGLNVSVYSVYVSVVVLTFNDCIGLIVANWFIEDGRLQRINISEFKSLVGVVENLVTMMYDRLCLEYGEEHRDLVNQFLEPDSIIRMCTPFTRCVINSEFDYCKYILHRALENEQLIEVSDGSHDYQCSSLVIDAVQLLSTILREIISGMNFTESGIHSIFSGFSGIVGVICNLLEIENSNGHFQHVEDLFAQKSGKNKFLKTQTAITDSSNDSIASIEISMSYESNESVAKEHFSALNNAFDKFEPRVNRSTVFYEFNKNKQAESMEDCFDAIDFFVFRINAMEKLLCDFKILFEELGAYPIVNPRVCDHLVPIFREIASIDTNNNLCDEYVERIKQELSNEIDMLSNVLADYLACALRSEIQQIYCPNPQTCQFSLIMTQIRQIMTEIRENACQEVCSFVELAFCRKIANIHALIVLDSAHRARTIQKADFSILSQDFTSLVDILCKFVSDVDVEEIMALNLKILTFHANESGELIAIYKESENRTREYSAPKPLKEVENAEIALRVLNFRRYCDTQVRKFMQNAKRELE